MPPLPVSLSLSLSGATYSGSRLSILKRWRRRAREEYERTVPGTCMLRVYCKLRIASSYRGWICRVCIFQTRILSLYFFFIAFALIKLQRHDEYFVDVYYHPYSRLERINFLSYFLFYFFMTCLTNNEINLLIRKYFFANYIQFFGSKYSFNLNGESSVKIHNSYRLLTYLFNIWLIFMITSQMSILYRHLWITYVVLLFHR